MPVHDGAVCLEETLDSIQAQTFTDFELIISDNASTDRTEEICRAYAARDDRIRYVRNQENLGASKNFNRTFELSAGAYFKWAAHDDPLAPAYLQRCVDVLHDSPESVVLCFPDRILMAHDGRVIGPDPPVRWAEVGPPFDRISYARLMRVPGLLYPILVFGLMRADALRKTRLIGAYSHADLVLVQEMRLLGEFRHIPEPLFFTRLQEKTVEFVASRRTWQGEAAWYDPAKRTRRPVPEAKLLWERLAAVKRAKLGPATKLWCYGCTFFGHLLTRGPGWAAGLARAAKGAVRHYWEKCSVAAVRESRNHQVPHRLWALSSGLRHLDPHRIALAVAASSPSTQAALLEFVARRLSKRHDVHAERLLTEWLNGACEQRRTAAARALVGRRGTSTDTQNAPVECRVPSQPSVSVIMPMRNAERYVEESLRSLLAQRDVDLEVVVVDDGSTDRSSAVVRALKDPRIRLVQGRGEGISAALNIGLRAVRAPLVARCDADDLYPDQRLSWQVDWLMRHRDYGAVCGGFSTIDPRGRRVREMDCGQDGADISEELSSGITRTHFSAFTTRRDVLERLGGFRSYFDGCEDIDMQLRLGQACRVRFEPRPCYVYRLHDASITHRRRSAERDFFEATARRFATQRRTGGRDDLDLGRPPTPPGGEASAAVRSARTHIQGMLIGRAWRLHQSGRVLAASAIGLRACLVRPGSLSTWKSLAALVIKRPEKVSGRVCLKGPKNASQQIFLTPFPGPDGDDTRCA